MQARYLVLIAAILSLIATPVAAATFFSDDFESYDFDADVSGIGGWTISHTLATIETEADWHLLDTWNVSGAFGLPSSTHFGPATTGGTTSVLYNTPPGVHGPSGDPIGGRFISSGSDGVPVSASVGSVPHFPTFLAGTTPADPGLFNEDPWDSRFHNGTYTGASNDIVTPSFDTLGAAGDVWFHAAVSANLNDGGQAIFDVDLSLDGGTTWVNQFRRISPGSGRNIASGDFDSDVDVDGIDFLTQQRLIDFSDAPGTNPDDIGRNRQNTDQRFSDWSKAFNGVYTPLVATVADKNAGGHHGELDINLGAIGGNADVQVRFRHFESRDDESISIDDVRVDESAPLGSASQTIFSEDFNSMTLGAMDVYTWVHAFGAFGTDSGHGSSTISGHSWGAQDRPTISYADENKPAQGPPVIDASGRYDVGTVDRKNVNHLGHPTAEGASGEVPFAIIDPMAEPEDSGPAFLSQQSERLHTPVLDLSGYDTVILEWDDETIFDGNPFAGSVASVVLMLDDDGTAGPSDGDTILNEPDKFGANDLFDPYVPYDQFAGGLFAGGDDPIFAHHRLDISADAAGVSNLYIAWQFNSARTDYWAVDNILITGELIPALAAIATPEPTSLLLALVGLSVVGARRRRNRLR